MLHNSAEVARAEEKLTLRQRRTIKRRAQQRRDEEDRYRDAQQQRRELAAAGVELIRRKFGPGVVELREYRQVWDEICRMLRGIVTLPVDSIAASSNGQVEVTDQAESIVPCPSGLHTVIERPSGELPAV